MGLYHPHGRPDVIPGCWLGPAAALTAMANGGVNQWLGGFSPPSLPYAPRHSIFKITYVKKIQNE